MKKTLLACALACAGAAQAENPHVLLDTDFGPLWIELAQDHAPGTVANFLAYVDAGRFDDTIIQRTVKDFIVQGGGFKSNGAAIQKFPAIASERHNGLLNVPGTLAMALSAGTTSQYNLSSAKSDFFINTKANTSLDEHFTVFGHVEFGLKTLASMNSNPLYSNTETPIRPPLIRRAVRTDGFPILPLHTGAWYDPAKSGRGLSVEIANEAGNESGPLVIVYWYDYAEGEQLWLTGAQSFNWGDSSVSVPMQSTRGGQFGAGFDPAQVERTDWGTLNITFSGCDTGNFSYTSIMGDGVMDLRRITLPVNDACAGQQ